MGKGERHSTRRTADTGLNNSDLEAADADTLRSASSKAISLTPLASFSAEELSQLRRTSPDAYHALLQYEQLCRHNAAVIEAKEMELHRCIGVGQEVLGQLDQMQSRCSQLAKERDGALAKIKELQQRVKRCAGVALRGESSNSPARIQPQPQGSEDFLREELRRCESEAKESHVRAKQLEKELQEQRQLHDALKRDLQSAVQVARSAGKSSEMAEAARRSSETTLVEMQRRMEEKERELSRSLAAQRETENSLQQRQREWALTLTQHREIQQPSVEALAAAAQLATMHNQLQDIVLHAERCCKRRQQLLSAMSSQRTRLRVPTTGGADVVADRSITAAQVEQWIARSLEETAQLVSELSRLLQQVEERQRCYESDYEVADAERQLALDQVNEFRHENGRLRQALVALREEVQTLDAQTDRLREVDVLEARQQADQRLTALEVKKKTRTEDAVFQLELERARHQCALELATLHRQLEEERHTVEQEIRSLRAEHSRWREEEKSAASVAACVTAAVSSSEDARFQMRQQQLTSESRVGELEAENQRLREKALQEGAELQAEIARLERDVQDGKSYCKRLVQQHEEEIETMMRAQRELQRNLREGESVADRRVEELQREKEHLNAVVLKLKSELLEAHSGFESATRESEEAEMLSRQRHEAELRRLERDMAAIEESSREKTAELTAENAGLKVQLEQAQCSGEAMRHEMEREVNVATIAALNRELCDVKIEAARFQDALHRSSQKMKELANSTVSVDRYEQIETELMQEREHAQELTTSLAASRAQIEELHAKLDEQRQCVQDCLRLLPLSPAKEFARVALLLQAAAERAAGRLILILEEAPSASIPSISSLRDETEVGMPPISLDTLTPSFRVVHSAGSSPRARPPHVSLLPHTHSSLQQPIQEAESGLGRTFSPVAVPGVNDLISPSSRAVWQHHDVAEAFSTSLRVFLSDLTAAIEQIIMRPYADLWEALEKLGCFFSTLSGDTNNALQAEDNSKSTHGNEIKNSIRGGTTNKPNFAEEGALVQQSDTEKDSIWVLVASGIMDAHVDACAAVFQRLQRATMNYLREREEEFQRSTHRLNTSCEERVRCTAHEAEEQEYEFRMQMETARAKFVTAQRSAEEAHTRLENMASRYNEMCTRVEHLEERLASKQREWETERKQWCDTVNELQSEFEARRQDVDGRDEQLQRQMDQLQDELQVAQEQLRSAREDERRVRHEADDYRAMAQREIQRLERELEEARALQDKAGQTLREIREQLAASNLALQQRQNDDMSRERQAERTIEALQQELREARAVQQALQRSLSAEEHRSQTAENRSKELGRLLEEQRAQTEVLEERVAELREVWQLQQKTLDVETQETEALRKVNRVLEERLAEVEGDREPLRQQLQSLLMLQSR